MQGGMKNFFQIDNWSRQKNFILETIKIARKYPLDQEKFDKWYYDDGSMSKEESEKIWLEFNKASVQVDTLVEYKFLLDQLGSDKQYNIETLAHENAHANKAEQLGGEYEGKDNYLSDGDLHRINNPGI